ncbi:MULTISPECIES: preprotein translocase subunit SecG [unclassified Methylibium]|jgi:preprotein translocase subunit SecG|uniref:preprotein translocase subunit SecG n=1 Tax=unclassified Methylibium TaxID=2633235 RepID=UPI0006F26C30|nr:preprotein translocase subunit SecG [Methylibium sp. Root1272]KQW67982.1 preprotein translocase subunit SecG [Methylibium sp. Root1272]
MQMLLTVMVVVQMLSALVMIGLVLIQHGKGADMGASFGSGASGSLFGATGSANFLSRSTGVCAAVFFACTLALAYFGNLRASTGGGESILERAVPASSSASAAPASQIPGAASAAAPVAVPQSPAPEASGAAQIPAK